MDVLEERGIEYRALQKVGKNETFPPVQYFIAVQRAGETGNTVVNPQHAKNQRMAGQNKGEF